MLEIKQREKVKSTDHLNDNPVLADILASRGVQSPDELDFSLKSLPNPDLLLGMAQAVELLVDCLTENKKILIVGDYDADGATSTALAMKALQAMGAKQISFLVPNRFEYGYGLSTKIVELAAQDKPDLIVTVDNGIASIDGVAKAHELKIQVLITDHHLAPKVLPEADAIVNPNLEGDTSNCQNMAGVGVIFYVMLALRKRLVEISWFKEQSIPSPNLADLLDFVALGTIADVVKLDALNRILVEQGLRRIRANKTCPGIRALLRIAGKSQASICSSDMGFAIGPRLNAAGRLSDMSVGIECLLSTDESHAYKLATRLDELNKERRSIEQEMREEADVILQSLKGISEHNTTVPALCLYKPDWHQGVIGILASRIKDSIHRPVIIFSADDNGMIKGSGRSIKGIHLRDALDSVASKYPKLIEKFGGHAMAAGLSLAEADFEQFQQAFVEEIKIRSLGLVLNKHYLTDGELPDDMLNLHWAKELRYLAPWGQGFEEPCFDGVFNVQFAKIVAQKHLKLRLGLPNSADSIDAIAFNIAPAPLPRGQVRVVYRLDINEFRGECNPQLLVDYLV